MPKKRQQLKSFKPSSPSASASSSASSSANKPSRGVNELLADLRRTSLDPSAPRPAPAHSPSVPPAIREILQLPETPPPVPRRGPRQRFDGNGRRLPAGPPPPRSWVSRGDSDAVAPTPSLRVSPRSLRDAAMPGAYLPAPGSLVDMVLRKVAFDWAFHRVFNQYHMFFLPGHLKPGLIRLIGAEYEEDLSLADLKLILLPPPDVYADEDLGADADLNEQVTYLDLMGSVGRSIRLKELSDLLFETRLESNVSRQQQEPEDSWETAELPSSPPRVLLPNLTHLSLALDPQLETKGSWKQLLALSSKLRTVTHLSLAYWPDPCLTPRGRLATVTTPQGRSVPYGGTNYYSHSLDHDWSEALLVLRMLSRSLYALEYLDLTGCAPWFRALVEGSGHDYVDWAGAWGKITLLRLYTGWKPQADAMPSERTAYEEAARMAASVERHIRRMRAGQGRFITVERDVLE